MREFDRDILEKYDVKICNTRKIRGAVLCDTEQGLFLLKEVSVPQERIQVLAEFYDFMENQQWCVVDKIIANKEGQYLSEIEGVGKFILKRWFPYRECDIKKTEELLEASGTLAKLHLHMKHDFNGGISDAVCIDEEYNRHNRELKKVRSFIRNLPFKNEFEIQFLKYFEDIYARAEMAKELLVKMGYKTFRMENLEQNCMVHGEYNYHNILMNENKKTEKLCAITNFDKLKKDIQVEDFYYFFRKVMEKYGWKERLGDNMLNAYSAVKPLTEKELEYIKLRILYPEKFWKTANAYYHSNKAWISAKNTEKLNISIRQAKEKESFLKNIFSFNP